MTYYEYVKIVKPEYVHENGFVDYCPHAHGLPSVSCPSSYDCIDCYMQHEVPEDMARDLLMEPIPDEDLMKMIGGMV